MLLCSGLEKRNKLSALYYNIDYVIKLTFYQRGIWFPQALKTIFALIKKSTITNWALWVHSYIDVRVFFFHFVN